MANRPHIDWDACPAFVGHPRDHLLWNRCEAAPKGLWDLQHVERFGPDLGFGLGSGFFSWPPFPVRIYLPSLSYTPSYLIFGCSQGEIGNNHCGSIPELFAKRYGLRRSDQISPNLTDFSGILRPLTGIAWLSKVPSPHSQPLADVPHVPALHFASQVFSRFRTGLPLAFCATLHLLIDHPELLCERRFHHKQCTLTRKRSTRSQQVNPQPIARPIYSIRGDTLPQTSFPLDIFCHPPPLARRLSDPSKHLSAGFHSVFPAAPFIIPFTWVCGLLRGGIE